MHPFPKCLGNLAAQQRPFGVMAALMLAVIIGLVLVPADDGKPLTNSTTDLASPSGPIVPEHDKTTA